MAPLGERANGRCMRIALVSEHASPLALMGGVDAGGQNVYVNHVARCLGAMGHHVDVFTRQDQEGLSHTVEIAPRVNVRHIVAGPMSFVPKEKLLPHMSDFAAGMRRVMSAHRYDLIHANFFMSGLASLRIKDSLNLPLVMTFHALGLVRQQHQPETDAFPPVRVDIERMLVDEADALVAECPQDELDLTSLYDADPARIAMVPCGIDTAEIHPMPRAQARAELGLAQDEFLILQLGRLVPRKGIDNVVRSLAHLPAGAKFRLLVVGGESREPDPERTPEIARLSEIAAQCGVADKVTFVGHRQRHELHRYFCASDVFVTTPWYEPFGITPLEAMACAVPVIGARVGGIKYSVMDGLTGLLVPPKQPEALGDALTRLLQHPKTARNMGLEGLRRVRSLFTWNRVAHQLEAVYRHVLSARSESPGLVGAGAHYVPPAPAAITGAVVKSIW